VAGKGAELIFFCAIPGFWKKESSIAGMVAGIHMAWHGHGRGGRQFFIIMAVNNRPSLEQLLLLSVAEL